MTNGRDPSLSQKQDFINTYRDLISIETVAMLNAAFCDYHIKHCPASEQLVTVCREVRTACGLVRAPAHSHGLSRCESPCDCVTSARTAGLQTFQRCTCLRGGSREAVRLPGLSCGYTGVAAW